MFGFIRKCFFSSISFFSYNILNVNYLECVSINDQGYKISMLTLMSPVLFR